MSAGSVRRRKLLSSLFVGFCGAVGAGRARAARVRPVLRRQPGDPVAEPRRSSRRCRSRWARPAAAWRNAIVGTLMVTGLGAAVRRADRDLSGVYMSEYAGHPVCVRRAVRRRHAERRAVDRHRRVRLRHRGAAVQAVQRARRRPGARHHDDSDHRADHRGAAAPRTGHDARRRAGARRHAGARGVLASSARRRCRASSPGSCSRWRASPARRRRCSSRRSTTGSSRTDLDQPIATLTVQVYTYAISPYQDWHRQAWAGALVLVVIVLDLLAACALRHAAPRGYGQGLKDWLKAQGPSHEGQRRGN